MTTAQPAARPRSRRTAATATQPPKQRTDWTKVILGGFSGLVLLFLVAPVLIVVPMSFSAGSSLSFPPAGLSLQWYENFFGRADWTSAAIQSFRVAAAVTVLATTIGTMASLALVRGRFRGKQIINILILSPIIVPSIVIAIAVFGIYSTLRLTGTYIGLVLAHTVFALPFVVIVITATLRGFDINLENAANNLGANALQTFRYVTLPIIAPGVFAGALFAFVASFDELIISLFIAGAQNRTLPIRMFEGLRLEIDPTIAAVSTMLTVLTVSAFGCAEILRRRAGGE
jgi:putative spermidine/putrescine transport system permease protein